VEKRQNLAFLTESSNTKRAKLFCTSCNNSTYGINTNAENVTLSKVGREKLQMQNNQFTLLYGEWNTK
jgi:hypothetical protein